jgi:hypothetical protein
MKFETVKHLDDEKFRRLTGIKRPTFDKMVRMGNDARPHCVGTPTGGMIDRIVFLVRFANCFAKSEIIPFVKNKIINLIDIV